jgi:hypothetical protein
VDDSLQDERLVRPYTGHGLDIHRQFLEELPVLKEQGFQIVKQEELPDRRPLSITLLKLATLWVSDPLHPAVGYATRHLCAERDENAPVAR